jgi:F-type H+-transporting ATPase subunit epsilon
VLETSVVSWHRSNGTQGHCAVRGGVLMVSGGERIAIATREAVLGDDLVHLESEVLETFRRKSAEEQSARASSARLQLAAMRQILDYLRPGRDAAKRPPLGFAVRKSRR